MNASNRWRRKAFLLILASASMLGGCAVYDPGYGYYQPQPAYQPAYVSAPAPVYVQPPVYVPPPVFFSFGYRSGGGHWHGGHRGRHGGGHHGRH